MNLTVTEKTAQAHLKRFRLVATSLLILAALGYVLTIKYINMNPYVIYIKAFCEASMIGGLADWFAVVALFKRPLGLPIPHTAIFPKNKEKIAKQASVFIEDNFLQPSVIAKTIYDYQPSQLFLNWLSHPTNRKNLNIILSDLLSNIINHIKSEWLSQLILETSQKKLNGKQIGHHLAILLTLLKNNGYAQKIFDDTIVQITKWLQAPETRQKIEDSINTWAKKIATDTPPNWRQKLVREIRGSAADLMDRWLSDKIIHWIDEYCQTISNQPDHSIKEAFLKKWELLAHNLEHSPIFHQKINIALQQILASPTVKNFIQDGWIHFQTWLNQDIANDIPTITIKLNELFDIIIKETLNHPERIREINIKTASFIKEIVAQYKSIVSAYIKNRVSEWDSKELVQKLELNVGKDLQYIRVNGTLVGGLVGLIICWLTQTIQQLGLI